MTIRATIEGRIGSTPELKVSENGMAIATFRVASSKRIKDPKGEWADGPTSWVRVVCFRQIAEGVIESGLDKGDPITATGTLEVQTWEARDGSKGTTVELTADTLGVTPTGKRPLRLQPKKP